MSVLALADAKKHLQIEVETYDTELQTFIDAAEAAIAQLVGPLSSGSVTYRVPGWSWQLYLPSFPAVSLTSVTPVGGTALTLADLHLDTLGGIVSYNGYGFFSSAAYDVVYVAGRATCPADLLLAVKELVRHLWLTQRGASRPGSPIADGLSNTLELSLNAFPFRIQQLIEPHGRRQKSIGA